MTIFNELSLSHSEVVDSINKKINLDDDWGWCVTVDTGVGENYLITYAKVSGETGAGRKVEHVKTDLVRHLDGTHKSMAESVIDHIKSQRMVNPTISINTTGIGYAVAEIVSAWGKKQNIDVYYLYGAGGYKQGKSFLNRTVAAYYMAFIAIKEGRVSFYENDSVKLTQEALAASLHLNGSGKIALSIKGINKPYSQARFRNLSYMQLSKVTPHNQMKTTEAA